MPTQAPRPSVEKPAETCTLPANGWRACPARAYPMKVEFEMRETSSATSPRRRRLAATLVGALVASLAAVVASVASAPAAYADVQQPYVCPDLGAWNVYLTAADVLSDDVVETRSSFRADYMTGPLSLGVALDSTFIRQNDATFFTDYPGMEVALYRSPSHAKSFALAADGSFTWEPADGYLGGDSFQYTYRLNGRCYSKVATVTIPPAGTNPRIQNDVYTVRNDRPFSTPNICSASGCGVLLNDLFTRGAEVLFRAEAAYAPKNGTLTARSDGGFTYVANPGFVGQETLYYSILWAGPGSAAGPIRLPGLDAASITLNVVAPPPSTVPITVDDAFDVVEDTPVTITAAQLLGNDIGAGAFIVATNTTATGQTQPTPHGSIAIDRCEFFEITLGQCIVLDSIQAVTYTPSLNYNGPDYFGYYTSATVPSTFDTISDVGWVALNVTPVDDPPVVNPDGATLAENTSVTIDVLANDDDPEGDLDPSSLAPDPCVELPVCVFRSLANGSWVINDDATITYTPTPGFVGQAGFHYQVSDSRGAASRSFVVATVTPNPAVDDAYSTDEDTLLTVPAPGVLGNDRAGSTSATLDTGPEDGTLALAADGSFTYQPDRNFFGTDSFVYRGLDGDPATVTIEVAPVNDNPSLTLNTTCDPQSLPPGSFCSGGQDDRTVDEGSAVRVRGLVTDPDFDPGTLTVSWGDGNQLSTDYPCFIEEDCEVSTTPTFADNCSLLGCSAPLSFDFWHTYADGAGGAGTAYPVSLSATDAGGGTGTATTTAIVLNVPPTVTVAPACDGALCFGFFSRLNVAAGETVTLQGRVTDPGADDGTLVVDWGDGSDPSEIDLTCTVGEVCPQQPQQSELCSDLSPTAACGHYRISHTYAAPAGPDGYAISLTATDDDGGVGTATATARIANAAPVTTDAVLETDEDTPLEIDLGEYVSDPGSAEDELTFEVTGEPEHGTLTGTGALLTYTPKENFFGADGFTVEVCDAEPLCETLTATITVTSVDDPPVALDDEASTAEDTPFDIAIADLLANDSDVDGELDVSTFTIDAELTQGTVEVVGDVVRYAPAPDAFGTDTFAYSICSDGACASATVTIEVTPVDDPPSVLLSGPESADEGADVEFTFEVRDFDPGDTFVVETGYPSCVGGALVAGSLMTTAEGGSFSCRWANGPDDVTATIGVVDSTGLSSQVASAALAVQNVAPTLALEDTGSMRVAAGAPVTVSATFDDPGDDTHSASVDWGDGSSTDLDVVTGDGFEASHTYAAAGAYTIVVSVTDSDGDGDSASVPVEVVALDVAVRSVASELVALAATSSGNEAKALRAVADTLIGNNNGRAANGVTSALGQGNDALALKRLLDAQRVLATVRTVDVTGQRELLAGVARALA